MSDATPKAQLPAYAKDNGDGTATVRLLFPIRREGDQLAELTMRRPKAADLRLRDGKGPEAGEQAILRALCQLTPGELDALDASDVIRLEAVAAAFLLVGLPTIETS